MEDAATAEISRAQLWQWISRGAQLDDGRTVTAALYDTFMTEELVKIRGEVGDARFEGGNFPKAAGMFMSMVKAERFEEFLTLPAYELLE
jgi:malate synthase